MVDFKEVGEEEVAAEATIVLVTHNRHLRPQKRQCPY